jgi:hypothetical protein
MAMIQNFVAAIAAGLPGNGALPAVHAILEGAETALCGHMAPVGWVGQPIRPITDWSQVSCPYCLAVANQPT